MPVAVIIVLAVIGVYLYEQYQGGTLNFGDQMRLTPKQIADLASNAGFQGNDLVTAVAVALAESGGKVAAYNPELQAGATEGKGSFGLWQIYRTAHPEFATWNLDDPQLNAQAAYIVYQNAGYSFRPWSTFKTGAYQVYVNQAIDGVTNA
jgi:hypothetical protein